MREEEGKGGGSRKGTRGEKVTGEAARVAEKTETN
jgi:hypothetical protein